MIFLSVKLVFCFDSNGWGPPFLYAIAYHAVRKTVSQSVTHSVTQSDTCWIWVQDILDISGIDSLRSINIEKQFRRIGATTTWSDIIKSELPDCYEMLKQCSKQVGSIQIQNSGTIGGNLCNASPAADGVPCLLSLNASIELSSKEKIRIQNIYYSH